MNFAELIAGILWVAGIVIAKGFWATTFALFPGYAWYLSIEFIMRYFGLI